MGRAGIGFTLENTALIITGALVGKFNSYHAHHFIYRQMIEANKNKLYNFLYNVSDLFPIKRNE